MVGMVRFPDALVLRLMLLVSWCRLRRTWMSIPEGTAPTGLRSTLGYAVARGLLPGGRKTLFRIRSRTRGSAVTVDTERGCRQATMQRTSRARATRPGGYGNALLYWRCVRWCVERRRSALRRKAPWHNALRICAVQTCARTTSSMRRPSYKYRPLITPF